MRRPVTDALSPRRVRQHREQIQQIAENLLDELPETGSVELVSTFAARFSFTVLSEMIGLPPALRRRFRREWCKVVQPVGPRSPQRAAYVALLEELQDYIADVIQDKRQQPFRPVWRARRGQYTRRARRRRTEFHGLPTARRRARTRDKHDLHGRDQPASPSRATRAVAHRRGRRCHRRRGAVSLRRLVRTDHLALLPGNRQWSTESLSQPGSQ